MLIYKVKIGDCWFGLFWSPAWRNGEGRLIPLVQRDDR